MKAAVIGAGFIGRAHIEALRGIGVEPLFAVDTDSDACRDLDIPRCESMDSAPLEDVDCVHICTPPALHFDGVLKALERCKNVICEKPLVFSPGEAEKLCLAAERAGGVCAVGFNLRFYEAIERAKSEDAGTVHFISGSYFQQYNVMPNPCGWRFDAALSPLRAVSEIGSHWFDLAEYLSGSRICGVFAEFSRFMPRRVMRDGMFYPDGEGEPFTLQNEDAASVLLRFENGASGCVALCEAAPGRVNRLSIELTGEAKTLHWNSEAHDRLDIGNKEGMRTVHMPFGDGFAGTQRRMLSDIYGDIARGGMSAEHRYCSFRTAAHNARVCAAALESSKSGVWAEVTV